jgi:hypothetical protein
MAEKIKTELEPISEMQYPFTQQTNPAPPANQPQMFLPPLPTKPKQKGFLSSLIDSVFGQSRND